MSLNDPSSIIRVDSADEQYAYLTSIFGEPGHWNVTSQTWSSLPGGESIEIATLRLLTGETVDVRFGGARPDDDSFDGSPDRDERPSTGWLDDVTEAAVTFSQSNPPHHPGTIARFPVPAAGYANALSVPMGLIAVDGSSRGLYAPPRIVALNVSNLEPIGVGEFPDFDPEFWPPERLDSWPLAVPASMSAERLQGTIQRFSACWSRVIDAWFAGAAHDHAFLATDIRAALAYRSMLDTEAMTPYYDRMNPVFASWLRDNAKLDRA